MATTTWHVNCQGIPANISASTVVIGDNTDITNFYSNADQCKAIQDQLCTRYINHFSTWTIPRINSREEFEYVKEDRSSFMVELTLLEEPSLIAASRPTNELNRYLLQRRPSGPLLSQPKIVDSSFKCNLLTGITGVGKTSAIENEVLSWARKHSKDFEYVFLFSCRNLHRYMTVEISAEQLFRDEFNIDITNLNQVNGETVLIIIDGLDEIESLASLFEDSGSGGIYNLLHEMIKEQSTIFPGHTTLLAGRPHIVSTLKRFQPLTGPIRTLQILGFRSDAIRSYVEKFSNNDDDLRQRILDKVFNSTSVNAMAHIPQLLCSICSVYSWGLKDLHLHKKSELFVWTLLSLLRHQFPQFAGTLPHELVSHDVVRRFILVIAKLSYRLLQENRILFEEKEVKELETTDALLKTLLDSFLAKVETSSGCTQYQFRHLIIQDFFAAIHCFVSNTSVCKLMNKELYEIAEFMSGFVRANEITSGSIVSYFVKNILEAAEQKKGSFRQRFLTIGARRKLQSVSLIAEEVFLQWRRWKISCECFCNIFYELYDIEDDIPEFITIEAETDILLSCLTPLRIVRLCHFFRCMLRSENNNLRPASLVNVRVCIEHTEFSNGGDFHNFLQLLTKVKDVRFDNCSFTDDCLEILCKAISSCHEDLVLDGLSIRYSDLSKIQLFYLANCAPLLQRFSLIGEKICFEATQAFAQQIFVNENEGRGKLKELELRDCSLSDLSITEISKVLHMLETVNLSENSISSVRVIYMIESAAFRKYLQPEKFKLETLLLRNCVMTSEGLKEVEMARKSRIQKHNIFVGL